MAAAPAKLCQEPYHVLVKTPRHQRLIPHPHVEGQSDAGRYDVEDIPARDIGTTIFCRLDAGHEGMHEAVTPPPEMVVW